MHRRWEIQSSTAEASLGERGMEAPTSPEGLGTSLHQETEKYNKGGGVPGMTR